MNKYTEHHIGQARVWGGKWLTTNADGTVETWKIRPVISRNLRDWRIPAWGVPCNDEQCLRLNGKSHALGDWRESLEAIPQIEVETAYQVRTLWEIAQGAKAWAHWITIASDGTVTAWEIRPEDTAVYNAWANVPGKAGARQTLGSVQPQDYAQSLFRIDRNADGFIDLIPASVVDAKQKSESHPPPAAVKRNDKNLYLDLMQRIANAVADGRLPDNTFQVLWGE